MWWIHAGDMRSRLWTTTAIYDAAVVNYRNVEPKYIGITEGARPQPLRGEPRESIYKSD